MPSFGQLCQQYAQILNGTPKVEHGVCSVEFQRNLHVTIQGRPSRGELHAGLTFESVDQEGKALNLGEIVLLEEEVPLFTSILVKNKIIISALHNHWMYTKPSILYLHFQSVESPLTFAHKMSEAFRALKINVS
ncbi:DUF1259 domain-containing protein [Fictibacillus sp. KIGAM418]|uniref:DUF1259 domain-containing protein n=1 Tax=Fictibacillus marinisediminis TaxID=2878389 RepID=A0A9X2BGD5_9BACL|nr:DUF1259 domain-containing protein [Fictibacillus marinisediminis]MCK6258207.1 DUF1259 domain-containing protein [Fictibacillus marinisediminis]